MSVATRLTGILTLSLALAAAASADNVRGAWSSVASWPLIAIHAVLLPDGRVLTYGTDANGQSTGLFIYDVWNPSAGLRAGHLTLPNTTETDFFCSSALVLPQSGNVVIVGGDIYVNGTISDTGNNKTNVFNVATNSLSRGSNMQRKRWYSTSTTLPNGETYIQGGVGGGGDRPEIRTTGGIIRLLSSAVTTGIAVRYPRNFVAPDGRIFGFDILGQMYYVTASGSGSVTRIGALPFTPRDSSSTAMFRPGLILQLGGASAGAYVIDINRLQPKVTATRPLSSRREWVNATVLADGRVLATGGSVEKNKLTGVNNTAEIWNPSTGQWTQGKAGAIPRLYHSTALLLVDGSVLVAGGGAPGPLTNLNAELYFPPYLFDASGARAARPSIVSAPGSIAVGSRFAVGFGNASRVSRITLVKTGSATHSLNMDQRFVELTFTASGNMLDVRAPARATDAPPGYYLLFVFDDRGVPSRARIIRVNVAS